MASLNRDSRFLGNVGCHIGCILSIYIRCLNTKSKMISLLLKDIKFKGFNDKSLQGAAQSALVVVARETSVMQLWWEDELLSETSFPFIYWLCKLQYKWKEIKQFSFLSESHVYKTMACSCSKLTDIGWTIQSNISSPKQYLQNHSYEGNHEI